MVPSGLRTAPVRTVKGIRPDPWGNPSGLLVESVRTAGGIRPDCRWNPSGLPAESVRILGKPMEYPFTLWGECRHPVETSGTPHQVAQVYHMGQPRVPAKQRCPDSWASPSGLLGKSSGLVGKVARPLRRSARPHGRRRPTAWAKVSAHVSKLCGHMSKASGFLGESIRTLGRIRPDSQNCPDPLKTIGSHLFYCF